MPNNSEEYLVDGKYSIRDLTDINELRMIFEKFTEVTGFTIGFLDHPGKNVLIATGWRDVCIKFHRACPSAMDNCNKSNAHLLDSLSKLGEVRIEECDNGLVDCATPIIVKDKHIASLATGQLLLKPPDIDWFKKQAKKFGLNEKGYLEALLNVPVVDSEKLKKVTALLGEIAHIVSRLGYTNLIIKEEAARLEIEINKREKAEEQLKIYAKELERSNKELQSFAYLASHDLQEPLRMISSYLELIKKRYSGKLDPDADDFIDFAVNGAFRMKGLINGLLAYSRISTRAKALEKIDCNTLLKDVEKNTEIAIEESGAEIRYDKMPTIIAEKNLITQVFQNLIANAIKFKSNEAPKIDISAKEDGGKWLFSISDNGIGIDMKFKDRLFQLFQQLNGHENGGSGIGLAICRKAVEYHGGHIWVESEPGKGSTFFFTIPSDLKIE